MNTKVDCVVPFSSLVLEATGRVSVCRHKGLAHEVGDLRTETLKEIWNGTRIREWRRDFLSKINSVCRTEMRHRRCHIRAIDESYAKDVAAAEYQPYPPRRVALNLNGKCNLHCPMCQIWTEPNGFYRQPRIWRQIEEILSHVREIEMYGGEPFMQKDTYDIMKKVARVNPTCLFNITTNATWKLNDFVREHLDPLRIRQIIISADSLIPEVFAKLRPPARLEQFQTTVDALSLYDYERLRSGKSSLNLVTNSTIQIDNWREVPELAKFGEAHGNILSNLAILYRPANLSILSEPQEARGEMIRYLLEKTERRLLPKTGRVLRPLLESVPPLFRANLVSEHQFAGAFA